MDDCTKPHFGRGWCKCHYERWYRHGDPAINLMIKTPVPCSVDGCSEVAKAHGWCGTHYSRWRRTGTTDPKIKTEVNIKPESVCYLPCSVTECLKLVGPKGAKGFCTTHYHRFLRYGDPLAGGPYAAPGRECSVDGCRKPYRMNGFCTTHAQRFKKYGDPLVTKNAPPGSGHINRNGYKVVWNPDHPNAAQAGTILEHRLVMSETLGRPLLKTETVHHLNGDRLDNRPNNLELWNKSQPYGQRVEDKVRWALEILTLYGQDFQQPHLQAQGEVKCLY